jgi:hypothetical protein
VGANHSVVVRGGWPLHPSPGCSRARWRAAARAALHLHPAPRSQQASRPAACSRAALTRPPAPAQVWSSNRGVTLRSLYNPWLRQKLHAMGLSPATAFGCLFDLLYRPTPGVLALYNSTLQELLQPDVLKIGVQVRGWRWCCRWFGCVPRDVRASAGRCHLGRRRWCWRGCMGAALPGAGGSLAGR